jgi:putative lipoic acid-binding regulatory protein
MADKDTLLEFPCEFPLKVMGATQDGFAEEILRVVSSYAPDFDASRMEMRASSGGNYISLTCTITATSKEQLDNLYRALTSHPMVKVVL